MPEKNNLYPSVRHPQSRKGKLGLSASSILKFGVATGHIFSTRSTTRQLKLSDKYHCPSNPIHNQMSSLTSSQWT